MPAVAPVERLGAFVPLDHVQVRVCDPPPPEGVDHHFHQRPPRSGALPLGKDVDRVQLRTRLRVELAEREPDHLTLVLDHDARVLLGQARQPGPPDAGLLLGRHPREGIGRHQPGVRLLSAAGVHPADPLNVGRHPAAYGLAPRHGPIMPTRLRKDRPSSLGSLAGRMSLIVHRELTGEAERAPLRVRVTRQAISIGRIGARLVGPLPSADEGGRPIAVRGAV